LRGWVATQRAGAGAHLRRPVFDERLRGFFRRLGPATIGTAGISFVGLAGAGVAGLGTLVLLSQMSRSRHHRAAFSGRRHSAS